MYSFSTVAVMCCRCEKLLAMTLVTTKALRDVLPLRRERPRDLFACGSCVSGLDRLPKRNVFGGYRLRKEVDKKRIRRRADPSAFLQVRTDLLQFVREGLKVVVLRVYHGTPP